jgi:acetate kinase
MGDAILILNAGSSSLKFSVYAVPQAGEPILDVKGQIEGIGTRPRLVARPARESGPATHDLSPSEAGDHAGALDRVAHWLQAHYAGTKLLAVGHRVVHGGTRFAEPVVVDDRVLQYLDGLSPLAPLHQPHNLSAIRAVRVRLANVPQVACFDTAFHRRHPAVADRFALPEKFHAEGVRRYGFHGLSYEYIVRSLPTAAPAVAHGRVVIAHLGSGASMCAVKDGCSMDSTMGFTALDGLPMGTRCGALDPGVVLYLVQEKGFDAKAIERLLYSESGLRGLSGISNDMRDLLASDAPGAQLALDYFVYRVSRELGALAAVLEGLDGIVFTAGIGENAPEIRARICARAAWLGVELDEAANRTARTCITSNKSRVSAWVIPTDEERMIAIHTMALLKQSIAAAV